MNWRRGRRRGMGASYIATNGGGSSSRGEIDGSPCGGSGAGAGCSRGNQAAEQIIRRHGVGVDRIILSRCGCGCGSGSGMSRPVG